VSVTAIIPLKALATAKGRLAGAMDSAQRRDLAAWMATQVITACRDCPAIDDVLLVAGDEQAADVGRAAGARVLVVDAPGLPAAMAAADAATVTCEATVVVAADLPYATGADVAAVVAAAESADVVIAPTDDGGTGALLRRPPSVMRTAYGPSSATAHIALAEAAGVAHVVVRRRGLAVDVDRPDQLEDTLAWRRQQAVVSPTPPHHTEESACRKAP